MVDELVFVDDGVRLGFDEGDDGLAKALVGSADDDDVVHRFVGLRPSSVNTRVEGPA